MRKLGHIFKKQGGWTAAAIVGSSLIGGYSSKKAADKQAKSVDEAARLLNERVGPYADAGMEVKDQLFNMATGGPNYDLAADKAAVDIAKYGSSNRKRGGGYDAALQNSRMMYENQGWSDRFNALAGLYTTGANAAAGQGTALANLATQKGNAQAAGYIGMGNAANSGMSNYLMMQMMSDVRLKENIQFIGRYRGRNLYQWEWNEKARRLGIDDQPVGVIAQEIEPELTTMVNGYLAVDYGRVFGED